MSSTARAGLCWILRLRFAQRRMTVRLALVAACALLLALPPAILAQQPSVGAELNQASEQQAQQHAAIKAMLEQKLKEAQQEVAKFKLRKCGASTRQAEYFVVVLAPTAQNLRHIRKTLCKGKTSAHFVLVNAENANTEVLANNLHGMTALVQRATRHISRKNGMPTPAVTIYASEKLGSLLLQMLWLWVKIPDDLLPASLAEGNKSPVRLIVADPHQIPLATYHLRWPLGSAGVPLPNQNLHFSQFLHLLDTPVELQYNPQPTTPVSLQMWELGTTAEARFSNIHAQLELVRSQLRHPHNAWKITPEAKPLQALRQRFSLASNSN